jgi:hypothetical protein
MDYRHTIPNPNFNPNFELQLSYSETIRPRHEEIPVKI